MSEKTADNRRRFDRLELRDEILVKEYSFPERGSYSKARIKDISGGGLLIGSERRFEADSVLKVEMNFVGWQRFTPRFLKHFGSAAERPLVVLAEVIRCSSQPKGGYEVAIRFSGIDESERLALIRFIKAEIVSRKAKPH